MNQAKIKYFKTRLAEIRDEKLSQWRNNNPAPKGQRFSKTPRSMMFKEALHLLVKDEVYISVEKLEEILNKEYISSSDMDIRNFLEPGPKLAKKIEKEDAELLAWTDTKKQYEEKVKQLFNKTLDEVMLGGEDEAKALLAKFSAL